MNNSETQNVRSHFLWGLAIFFAGAFLAFPEIIFGGQTLYKSDITWIHYPGHIFMAQEWLDGRIPLWDPYRQLGVPMLAEPQIGVLYPLRFIFLSSLSPSLELSLFLLIHFPLAAIFTYLLARTLQIRPVAAIVAGLSFGLGGGLMAQVTNLNIFTTAVWLPIIIYAAIKVTQLRRWLVASVAGVVIAIQFLSVHSQIVFYTLVTISAYGIFKIGSDFFFGPVPHRKNAGYALHTGLLISVMILTGLFLSAPQLFPSLELLQFTARAKNQGFELLVENSLPPFMWLNLLIPSYIGNNVVKFSGGDPFQEDFIYAGFIPLLLALWAIIVLRHEQNPSRKQLVIFFILLLGGGVLMAMGKYTPLYRYVIQYLPGFDLFRIPARWVLVVNLAVAVLAGYGLDSLLTAGKVPRAAVVSFFSMSLVLIGGLLATWYFRDPLSAWGESLPPPYPKLVNTFLNIGFSVNPIYEDRILLRWVPALTAPAILTIFNVLVAGLLLLLMMTRRLSTTALAWLIITATAIDLTVAGGTTINPIEPASRWDILSGGAKYVQENVGPHRVFPLGANTEAWAPTHLSQYYPSRYRILSAGGYFSPLTLARYNAILDDADPVQALQVLGVRYLLTPGQMGGDVAATYPLAYSDEESYVYENKNVLPRAFLVHQAIIAPDLEAAAGYLEHRAVDFGQTVVLEADPDNPPPPLEALPETDPLPQSTTTVINQNPQLMELRVDAAKDGYLVLLDTHYPGWRATVDGERTPIYRANSFVRAVFVPAGQHTVRFVYRPLPFWLGVGLAGLTLLVIITAAMVSRRPAFDRAATGPRTQSPE